MPEQPNNSKAKTPKPNSPTPRTKTRNSDNAKVTHAKKKYTHLARGLRSAMTKAEQILWGFLRNRRTFQQKFRRQHPIGPYIVDFCCIEKKLIIELDGGGHALEKEKDIRRDAWLRSQDFQVLRFWNNELLTNTRGVLETIGRKLSPPSPCPLPPQAGGEGDDSCPPGEVDEP